jgi:hypothetical protein
MLAQGEAPVANTIDVKVPDIGDYKDVPIIEVLVKPGDVVKADQSLVTRVGLVGRWEFSARLFSPLLSLRHSDTASAFDRLPTRTR